MSDDRPLVKTIHTLTIMAASQKSSSAFVEITPASPEQETVLANLLELYAHDFSEFIDLDVGADGRFGYESLPLYWKEPDRHPFLVRVNGQLAGFVFVRGGSQVSGEKNVWDVAEFFILRRYRRLGIGIKAAHEVWKRFPGRWEVRVMNQNQRAKSFWERAITEFTGEAIQTVTFDKRGELWHLYTFESRRKA